MKNTIYVTSVLLQIVLSAIAHADIIDLVPISSGTARDIDTDGIFDQFTSSLTTTLSPTQRPVWEFDLSHIPDGAVINSAILTATLGVSTLIGVQDEMMLTHGFIGNGTAEVADASVINQLGSQYSFLNPSTDVTTFLLSNVGQQSLGFALHSNVSPGQAGNTSGIRSPSLKVHFTRVPEPSTLALILLGLLGILVKDRVPN